MLSFPSGRLKVWLIMKTRFLCVLGICHPVVASLFCAALGADTSAKPSVPAIYDETADGAKQIADALVVARKENKRVLLQFGANWCGWCHKLHKLCQSDAAIAAKLKES